MPIHWKILSKKFLLNIFFFTAFFLIITIFFKLSKLTKYFLSGSDLKELFLLLGLFLHKSFPVALSVTSFASAYFVVAQIKKTNQIRAFASLGLNPQRLFSPLIILSIFLTIANLAISFIVSPTIKSKLDAVIGKKKEEGHLLNTFSNQFSRDNLYVSMDTLNEEDRAYNFLFINTDNEFSWIMADEILESAEGLHFKNLTYCKITPELEFDTILLSKDKDSFASKNTIYSLFHYSMFRAPLMHLSKTELTAYLLYLCNPIIFTILGICFALQGRIVLSSFLMLYTLVIFAFTTSSLSSLSAYLTSSVCILVIPLYLLEMRTCKKGQ